MPLESSSDAPVITRPQHLEQLPAGRLPGLVEHRVVRHVVPPVRLSGPYGRNIDELGGVSMSPVPSAQPVTVCCHRLRPTPGRRGQNQGFASLETGVRKGDAFLAFLAMRTSCRPTTERAL